MSDREQDPAAALGEDALEMSKRLAEGYKILANHLLERYKNSDHHKRHLDEKAEKEKIDDALKEGGFAVNDRNRQNVKQWIGEYEKNKVEQGKIAEQLAGIDKDIEKLETIGKMSPEAQKKQGYGTGDGLIDSSKHMDGLLEAKLKLGTDLKELQKESKEIEDGAKLQPLDNQMSIKEKLGIKSESLGAENGQTGLGGTKQPRPGSVFDSLVKSGYVEKGGLSFMNDKAIGQDANKHVTKQKL